MGRNDKYSDKKTVLDEFNECEDDSCDLDPSKICDNCGKCIEEDKNYKIIKITKIVSDDK